MLRIALIQPDSRGTREEIIKKSWKDL